MSKWEAGKQLDNNNYVVVKTLGEGGFGITYLAKDKEGDRVAIKTLNEKARSDPNFEKLKRDFYNEALRLAECKHPHIVAGKELIHVDGLPCIVMEYIPGEDLASKVLVKKDEKKKVVLEETEALTYISQIGEALIKVHQQNWLHRDVTPNNILIEKKTNKAILIDFGIAREYNPDRPMSRTTLLSEGYAPIEQYERKGKQGPHTDLHALAATLYFILTGTTPETAIPRATAMANGKEDPLIEPKQLNGKISHEVNDAILQGMALNQEHRPQTIEAWLGLFNPAFADENPTKLEPTVEVKEQPSVVSFGSPSRFPWRLILVGCIVIFLLAAFYTAGINKKILPGPDRSIVKRLSPYQNQAYGFQLEYPANWALREYQPNDFTKEVVELIAGDGTRKAKLYVEVRKLKETNICTIGECAAKIKQATEKSLTKAVLLDENLDWTVGQKQGYKLVYQGLDEEANTIKTLQVGTIHNFREYIITYTGEISLYSELEGTAMEIIDSFQFLP